MYYRICEYCGAALDPGEKCDCIVDMAARFEQEYTKKENALSRTCKAQSILRDM